MSSGKPAQEVRDVERIKAAYERRRGTVDPNRYSLGRPGNRLALEERQRVLVGSLARRGIRGLSGLDILEVGCGAGGELARLVSLGAEPGRIHGIDLREDAAELARSAVPGATIAVGDASRLPYPDGSFDLVYQAVALSSMPTPAMRTNVAAEMRRVARRGGVIVSYDFAWNPTNPDTVGISGRELRRLFPGLPLEIHRVTVVPALGRWLGDRSIRLARLAVAMPFLKSHRLALIDVAR